MKQIDKNQTKKRKKCKNEIKIVKNIEKIKKQIKI